MVRRALVVFLAGVVLGALLTQPVVAQQVVRLFGTQTGGTITPALINSSGALVLAL